MTGSRFRSWFHRRGVWFWAIAGTVTSVLLLWAGSQLAHDHGQSVEWYTGFGQWLGGLGSLIAAGVALWIAVTERRHAERLHEADLIREAGLVQVAATELRNNATIRPYVAAGVSVKNRRSVGIFDIKLTKFVMQGNPIENLQLKAIDLYPRPRENWYRPAELELLAVASDEVLTIFPKDQPDIPADYVAVEYTDPTGRRWQVDTERKVQRIL